MDLNELLFNSKEALSLFNKWLTDNNNKLPTISLFFELTKTDNLTLFQLSNNEHSINNLINNNNNNNENKLNRVSSQQINISVKSILKNYYLLISRIHNAFLDRVINNVSGNAPQSKTIDTYLRYFDELKAMIEKALNIQDLDNSKYTINITFE